MSDHGISEIRPGWRIVCACGQDIFIEGAQDPMPSYGAHAQSGKPLHPGADRAAHARDLGRIRLFKEK